MSPVKKQIECKDCFIPSKVKQKGFGDMMAFFFFLMLIYKYLYIYEVYIICIYMLKTFRDSLRWDYCWRLTGKVHEARRGSF